MYSNYILITSIRYLKKNNLVKVRSGDKITILSIRNWDVNFINPYNNKKGAYIIKRKKYNDIFIFL